MKISSILDHIDSGHMALPEFQRGYVWNRDQVRGLFDSLYRRHPIGGLLVWVTESRTALYRGEGQLAPGVVKLLLDGQQRMTSIYGVVRGKPPKFFDGNAKTFTGLYFHLEQEIFSFYQPMKMKDDPLWIDVSKLMQGGTSGLSEFISKLSAQPELSPKLGEYAARLSKLLAILDIELHVEEVTGADKTIEVVVDIFNRVNSGGTKLSKGDLALANFCFLTKDTNFSISDRLPEEYFPEVEKAHPGALSSQWIPMDPELWKIENFLDFLEARKKLLAEAVNERLKELLHGDIELLEGKTEVTPVEEQILGGFSSEEEEQELEMLNKWIAEQGLPPGILSYDFADPNTGIQKAVFDLAWPNGIQEELSEPVVVLLNEPPEVIALASQAGFRCFTSIEEFKQYVRREILAEQQEKAS